MLCMPAMLLLLGGIAAHLCVAARLAAATAVTNRPLPAPPLCRRAGLQLILSAALELSGEPPAAHASILALPVSALARNSSGAGQEPAGPAAPGQLVPRGRQRHQQPLAIECRRQPLTCVLLEGEGRLLASGGAGPLWGAAALAGLLAGRQPGKRPLPAAPIRSPTAAVSHPPNRPLQATAPRCGACSLTRCGARTRGARTCRAPASASPAGAPVD